MRKWSLSIALACGCSIALANAASAQVKVEVKVKAQPAIQVQALPVVQDLPAIQVQVGQAQAGQAIAQPGFQVGKAIGGPMIAPGFQQTRLGEADAILVGRVVAIEPMDVEAAPAKGQAKVKYRVAVVQVSESIYGLKKETQTVRVAFIAQMNNGPVNGPGGGVQILPAIQPGGIQAQPFPGGGRRFFPPNFQMNLEVGQDGMFILNKHTTENFYLSPAYNNFVTRQNNANFDNEVKSAKSLAKVMGNPAAALKGENKDDRYIAAGMLIAKYRQPANPTGMPMKQEPIDAEESKLILKALSGGDWTPGRFNARIPNPFELFNQLGINQNDGYNPVNIRSQQELATTMQKWLDENNGKYRISKLVVDPNAKQIQPDVRPGVLPVLPPGGGRPGIRPLPPVQIQPAPAAGGTSTSPAQPAPNRDK